MEDQRSPLADCNWPQCLMGCVGKRVAMHVEYIGKCCLLPPAKPCVNVEAVQSVSVCLRRRVRGTNKVFLFHFSGGAHFSA